MTITTKATAKVAAVAAGLAMATSMLSLAPLAHAQTPTAAASCTITMSLTVGSTGAEVICLQAALVAKGYLVMPVGTQMGYFGALTKSAVAKWQAANNIAPAVGYFGPISRAAFTGVATGGAMVPGCTSTTGYSTTTGQSCAMTTTYPAGCTSAVGFSPTTGVACNTTGTTPVAGLTGSGRLTNVSSLGSVTTNVKVGDGEVSVVGLSADASGGDVALQRVDATFTIGNQGGSASSNLDKYVSNLGLYLDGKKIASMDPASADKDGRVWTARFSGLNNAVIKNGQTGMLYVKVTPVSNIGTNEDGSSKAVITAALGADSVRGVSADGISDTYVTAGTVTHDFNVSSATTGAVNVTTASDNPVSGGSPVVVSTTASNLTSGVKLLSINVKATNADVVIDELPVRLSTSDNNIGDVVSSVYLKQGSTILSTKGVTNGVSTTTFTNLNQTIKKDQTVNFTVVVDLNGTGSAYSEGTTIAASTTVLGWDIQDSDGSSVTPTGSVTGNNQVLRSIGIGVSAVPTTMLATKTVAGNGTQETGTFTFTFDVTAFGADMYVSSTTNGFTPSTVYGSTGSATTTVDRTITSSATRSSGNNFVIYSGQTKPVTVTFTKKGQSGSAYARMLTLKFGTSDAGSLASSFTFPTEYQTSPLYLSN